MARKNDWMVSVVDRGEVVTETTYGNNIINQPHAKAAFRDWQNANVRKKMKNKLKISYFYPNYVSFIENNKKLEPMTKRAFIKHFKSEYAPLVESGEIRILSSGVVEVSGLTLGEPEKANETETNLQEKKEKKAVKNRK